MRYFFAIILPPVAVIMCGKPGAVGFEYYSYAVGVAAGGDTRGTGCERLSCRQENRQDS